MKNSYDDGLRKEVAGAGQTGSAVRTRRAALETLILAIYVCIYVISVGHERRLSWVEREGEGNCRKMQMVGHQTASAQPHPASSLRFLNDPLERQKVLVLGEKQSPAHASLEHVENHPPRRMSPRS